MKAHMVLVVLLIISCNSQNVNRRVKNQKMLQVLNPILNSTTIFDMTMSDSGIGSAAFIGTCGSFWISVNQRYYEDVIQFCNETQVKYKDYIIYQCRAKMPTRECEVELINTIVVSDKFSFNIELYGPAPPDVDCHTKFIPNKACNETNPEKAGIDCAKRVIDYLTK